MAVSRITRIVAREILDSRGNPTVECDVSTSRGGFGRAAVPSGASTGTFEAVELRDGGKRYAGLGVLQAVDHINRQIAKKLEGAFCQDQSAIDKLLVELDGTPNKSRLGANALLAVSLAVARAAAQERSLPLYAYLGRLANTTPSLPVPYSNVINGGKHAAGGLKMQEFMLVPSAHAFRTFGERLRAVTETYHLLKGMLAKKGLPTTVGDEGGFAPPLGGAQDALTLLEEAIDAAGYSGTVTFAIDAAASTFYYPLTKKYQLEKAYRGSDLLDYYLQLIKSYPITSLEDPFHEEDFESFAQLTQSASRLNVQIVGDDLLATNPQRIAKAGTAHSCNCLLLKVNQIGTLSEALEAAAQARRLGWNVMVSHRSAETEDSFIADLAVGLGCGQIKTGAPARAERTAKYNQLLRIEEELSSSEKKHKGKKR